MKNTTKDIYNANLELSKARAKQKEAKKTIHRLRKEVDKDDAKISGLFEKLVNL